MHVATSIFSYFKNEIVKITISEITNILQDTSC